MKENDPEHAEHFRQALSNYMGVLSAADDLFGEIPFDPSEALPDHWEKDPLTLLGNYLAPLNLTAAEKKEHRANLRSLIARHDAQWVWKNRLRLAAEIAFIRDF
ncbi:MAG: hypothetical protein JXA93_17185 [Anaerolineae bacterium]|nr:hypothetical protein [Anaerolineae bacterium]